VASIRVEIGSPDLAIAAQWQDLVARAAPNVFMDPAALLAADALAFARIFVLLAFDDSIEPSRLVGLWALRDVTLAPFWPSFLSAPPFNYGFVSTPVVDPAFVGSVVPAFLTAIKDHPALPKVVSLKYLDGSAETYPAIVQAVAAQGGQLVTLSERSRPYVTKDFGLKRSGSTRKKLRQDWNRLAGLGTADVVNDRSADAVREAFEVFLAMEAKSWKGAGGTALLCAEEDAAFARRLIGDLAARGQASVALLRIDGQTIATQVLLYCGRMAYTWKTAFNPDYGKYSPGTLLVDRVSEQLLAGNEVDAIESCSPEGGFMTQLWDGRRTTVDLLIDVTAKASLRFALIAAGERGYLKLRALRDRLRAGSQSYAVGWAKARPVPSDRIAS
jgi:CelD/BcsL family acetyltransferase involved in cellulose biosynthesis